MNPVQRVKVLLIENDTHIGHQVRQILDDTTSPILAPPQTEILQANKLALGLAYLTEMRFDAVLLAISQPDGQEIAAFQQLHAAAPATPILILCAKECEETAVTMMQQGAQGYLRHDQLQANILISFLQFARMQKQTRLDLEAASTTSKTIETDCRQILAQYSDGILVVDANGIILLANPAAEHILARKENDLIGTSFEYPLVNDGTTKLDIQHADRETAVIEMRQASIKWENQDARLVSLRNITARHQAKQELARKATELEMRNAELDTFAQTTAHQIQGLLSQMIGYTSYLEMHYSPKLDSEAQDGIRHILRSGHKMSNVLNELLLLAYVDKDDIPFVPLDMQRIVFEARKRMAFEIEEYNGEIIQPDTWPYVVGYASWIEEAWVNYISNGLKYGGTPPKIQLGWNQQDDGFIRFWVKDNGQGIPQADQKRLFKPHTRLKQMRATGEGLGLSIVQRIIKTCGGEVGVESMPGKGSTFWFTLPIPNDDETAS